jgi:hypothetical protein
METVILLKRRVKSPYLEDSWKLEAYLLVSPKEMPLLKSVDGNGKIYPEEEFTDFQDIIQLVMDQTGFVFFPALGIRLEINETKVVWPIQLLLKIDGMKIRTVETLKHS